MRQKKSKINKKNSPGKLPNIPVGTLDTAEGQSMSRFLQKCSEMNGLFDFGFVHSALHSQILGFEKKNVTASSMLIRIISSDGASNDIRILSVGERCLLFLSIAAGLLLNWDSNALSYLHQTTGILRTAGETDSSTITASNILALFSLLIGDLQAAEECIKLCDSSVNSGQGIIQVENSKLAMVARNLFLIISSKNSTLPQAFEGKEIASDIYSTFGQQWNSKAFFMIQDTFTGAVVSKNMDDIVHAVPVCYEALGRLFEGYCNSSQQNFVSQLHHHALKGLLSLGMGRIEEAKSDLNIVITLFQQHSFLALLALRLNAHLFHLVIHTLGALDMDLQYGALQEKANRICKSRADFPLCQPISPHGFCEEKLCCKGLLWIHDRVPFSLRNLKEDVSVSMFSPSDVATFPKPQSLTSESIQKTKSHSTTTPEEARPEN